MKFMNLMTRFVRDESGMETVEWGILAALVAGGLVTVVTGIGTNVLAAFTTLQTNTK